MASTPLAVGSFYANLGTKNRVGTTQSNRVVNADSVDLQSDSQNNKNLAQLVVEGFPTNNFTVGTAKSYESIPLTQAFQIWTFMENPSAFSAIMPIERVTWLNAEAQLVSHMTAMTQHAPERVRAFTLEQRRSRYSIHLQRYHIGVEVATFALDTEEGKANYINDLKAMRLSYYESNAIRTVIELQTCLTPWRDPTKRYGRIQTLNSDTLRQALALEREFFGVVQREANALELIDTYITRAQEKVQGSGGDTYIMSKGILVYNNQVPKENQTYSLGGPDKIAAFMRGPNGISMDSRGNTIVTFKSFERDGEPPLKPLLEYIEYMEYYVFRDVKVNDRYEADFEDNQRTTLIWDVDRDQWFGLTTKDVVENCHRFDAASGAPLGLNHPLVNRHDVEYTAEQFNDSYHYTTADGVNNRKLRRPCIFMGQIDTQHITIAQIKQKAGEHTVMKMKDLMAAGITSTAARRAITEARALLVDIEEAGGAADGPAYVAAALALGGVAPLAGANTTSIFRSSYPLAYFPTTNAYGGVAVPVGQAAAALGGRLRVPVGFGSYAGFKSIETAYINAGRVDATFTTATGLPADVARRVVQFLAVFEPFVSYAQAFYHHSFGADAAQAAPWWLKATAAHSIFDAVVTPQHRLPILLGAAPNLVSTPLVWSPQMLRRLADYTAAGVSFLNPRTMNSALTAADADVVAALDGLGGNAARFAGLDPAFLPITHQSESPAAVGSVLNNYLRTPGIIAGLQGQAAAAQDQVMMDGDQTGGAASGKRMAGSMSAGGRTLRAFGGAVAAAPAAPAPKRGRGIGVAPTAAGFGDLINELQAPNLVSTWDEIDADSSIDELSKWCIKLYLLSPFNKFVLLNWAARNLWVPISAIVFRCATLGTQSIIKVAAGRCGKQFIAFPSFRWNIDGILGVLRAQFDYYFSAKVTDPRLVFQADNVYLEQYCGGFGSAMVKDTNVTPTSNVRSITTERPSIYISLEPYNRQRYDDFISITGRKRDIGIRMGINIQDNDEMDYTNAPYHNRVYGHQAAVLQARKTDYDFWPGSSPVLAHRGLHKVWNPVTRDHSKTIGGTGYIPDAWVGNGLKRVLNGSLSTPPNYTHDYLIQNGV